MFNFINIPARMAGLLESNTSNGEIASGVVLALFLGCTPLNGPMAFVLALFFFLFKLNRTSTVLMLPIFKMLYLFGLSTVADRLGLYLLQGIPSLAGFWCVVTHLPVVFYLDINNTLVAGGLALSVALSLPVFFIARWIFGSLRRGYEKGAKHSAVGRLLFGLKMVGKVDLLLTPDARIAVTGVRQTVVNSLNARLNKKKGSPASQSFMKRINVPGFLVVIVVLALFHFGVGYLASPLVTKAASEFLNKNAGTKIAIGSARLWPLTLSLSMSDVKVFDPEDPAKRIAGVRDLSLSASPLGALSGRIVISQVFVNGLELLVEGAPDGTFNLQRLVPPKEGVAAKPQVSFPELTAKGKDWGTRVYDLAKKRLSKSAFQKKSKGKAAAKKAASVVTALPRGSRITFYRPSGDYLVEVRSLHVRNATISFSLDGDVIDIGEANLKIRGLGIDPLIGSTIRSIEVRGIAKRAGAQLGSIDIRYDVGSAADAGTRCDIIFGDFDLKGARFIYEKSLPVVSDLGTITLRARALVRDGMIDGRVSTTLRNHRFVAKDGSSVIFNFVPADIFCDALNNVQPLELSFDIVGPIDAPELRGFQESLMTILKPQLGAAKDVLIRKGADLVKGFIGKKTAGDSKDGGSAANATVDEAAAALQSLFGGKKE